MPEIKAELNSYRQSPRKVRLVADLVRGKKVNDALALLSFTTKRASNPVGKLIGSAVANARGLSIPPENLIVKEISVGAGATLYRRRPRSRGMANTIRKRTSHISVTLIDNSQLTKNKKQKTRSKKNSLSIENSKS